MQKQMKPSQSPESFADEFGYGGAPKVSPAIASKAFHEAHLVENLESVLRRRVWRIVRSLANTSLSHDQELVIKGAAKEISDLITAMREAHRAWKSREDATKRGKDEPIVSQYADESVLIAQENAAEEAAKINGDSAN